MDYAASTPVDLRVIKAMLPYFSKYFANPGSPHDFGKKAALALEKSRKIIAKIINAVPEEIIFTSSATESNNLALKGIAFANKKKGRHILISSVEHDCIIESSEWLKKQGFKVEKIPVDECGLVSPEDVKKRIKKDTILVSVMHANNEIGTIEPIEKIGKICRTRGVYFHTDAAQSFGSLPIDVDSLNVDLLTASSQKIYGPKGAAFLYVRKNTKIEPIIHGGGHEFGLRSGTVDVPAVIGFAKAAQICVEKMDKKMEKIIKLRNKLVDGIKNSIPESYLNGHPTKRLPNNVNMRFNSIEAESLLNILNYYGIAGSIRSASFFAKNKYSHVLVACNGLKGSHSSIRLCLGRLTSENDIDFIINVLSLAVKNLRRKH